MDKKKVAQFVLGTVAGLAIGYGVYTGASAYQANENRKLHRIAQLEHETVLLDDRLAAVEKGASSHASLLTTHAIQLAEHAGLLEDQSKKVVTTSKALDVLAGSVEKLHEKQDSLAGQLATVSKDLAAAEQATNQRLATVEDQLKKAGYSISTVTNNITSLETTFNNKIQHLQSELHTINRVLRELQETDEEVTEQPERPSAKPSITSVSYLRSATELQYVGFSVSPVNQKLLASIESIVGGYSTGMKKSRKEMLRSGDYGRVNRTELVFMGRVDGKYQRNMAFIESHRNSAYVFVKMSGNAERNVLADVAQQVPLSSGARKKYAELTE
ncbi:hypothetical protein HY639_05510 [Candidatus Woesearchaeota archaeon]|nr:hypothetical protein [Candidatus Woesearchaeota archaeon]